MPLVFALLPLLARNRALAVFPFFGSISGVYGFLGLAADGNITQLSGGTSTNIVTASLTSSTWQAVVVLPLILVIIDLTMAGLKAWGKL